jgi:hypothetical protein
MTSTFQIGRGIALFSLPNDRFDQITKAPLSAVGANPIQLAKAAGAKR